MNTEFKNVVDFFGASKLALHMQKKTTQFVLVTNSKEASNQSIYTCISLLKLICKIIQVS